MRARLVLPAVALAAGGALAVVPALAADGSVAATDSDTFAPRTVTVAVGERVTWRNEGGVHNVRFDDGAYEAPAEPQSRWTEPVERRFDRPGTYGYYCEAHGSPDGGMRGTVVVQDPGATPTPTATASPSPTPTSTPVPVGPQEDPAASFSVSRVRRTYCVRTCARPGVVLRVRVLASRAVTLRGTLRRRSSAGALKRFGAVRLVARPGRSRLTFLRTTAGRRLAPGRYVLKLHIARGGDGIIRTVRFRVQR